MRKPYTCGPPEVHRDYVTVLWTWLNWPRYTVDIRAVRSVPNCVFAAFPLNPPFPTTSANPWDENDASRQARLEIFKKSSFRLGGKNRNVVFFFFFTFLIEETIDGQRVRCAACILSWTSSQRQQVKSASIFFFSRRHSFPVSQIIHVTHRRKWQMSWIRREERKKNHVAKKRHIFVRGEDCEEKYRLLFVFWNFFFESIRLIFNRFVTITMDIFTEKEERWIRLCKDIFVP